MRKKPEIRIPLCIQTAVKECIPNVFPCQLVIKLQITWYVKRSALWHSVVTPKQKHEIHSAGDLASLLKYPGRHTDGCFFTTRMESGTANTEPLLLMASQLYAPWSDSWQQFNKI